MNKLAVKIIGTKQKSRNNSLMFRINEIEGLIEVLTKDFSEWSNFDCWENMGAQRWIFQRALDVFRGKKIDIQCECCEVIDLNQVDIKYISNEKCYGIKSAYVIENIVDEIVLAKESRKCDGTYST